MTETQAYTLSGKDFSDCIASITKSDKPGYGFVDDLVECIMAIPAERTGISHAVTIWSYEMGEGNDVTLEYHHPSVNRLNIEGIYKKNLFKAGRVVTSEDADVSSFVTPRFMWADNFIFIPIDGTSDKGDYLPILGGIMLLSKNEPICLRGYQAETLRMLLNDRKPNVYESTCVKDYVSIFQRSITEALPIGQRWNQVLEALACLSGNAEGGTNNIHGVRYATFWKLNNLDRLDAGEFYKQKEICYDNAHQPKASHESIHKDDRHFINDVRQYSNDERRVTWPMRLYSYNEVYESFADKDFLIRAGMGGSEMTAILIPVEVNGGVGIMSMDICCLYVKDIVYTPFISKPFCKQFQGYIKKSLEDANSRVQSEMVTKLMATYFSLKNNTRFYESVSAIMAKNNSMSDCLIYMRGPQDDLLYVRTEDVNDPKTFQNRSLRIGEKPCYLPFNYAVDIKFREYLKDLKLLDENQMNTAYIYRGEGKDPVVRSALFLCIQDNTQKESSGLIILINKTHEEQQKGERDFDVITRDNVYATYLSALYLHQFGLWNSAVSRKNYLLKKLRHEIPNCTRVIGEKVRNVRKEIDEKGDYIPSLQGSFNTIELNRNRINILASFFAAVDYEDSRFAEKAGKQDLVTLINENMPLFKEEAASKGVDVFFNKDVEHCYLNISNFYPLAIINVINNAIRYCSLGTNIFIRLYEDKIEITDVGLPISDMEMKLIFDDGYRSTSAKDIDAEGIGYGLHLTKRVLAAHHSTISADSDLLDETNFFLQACIAMYVKSLPPVLRKKFLYDGSEDSERGIINQQLQEINDELANPIDHLKEFYCKSTLLAGRMVSEQAKLGGPKFVEMDYTWFQNPVAKVTFTITFGNKIKQL